MPSETASGEARDLFLQLERLVPIIARRVAKRLPPSIELEDLEQTGRAALWRACVDFDPARRVTFPTYARMRICGAMLDSIRGPEFREASRERAAVRINAASQNRPEFGTVQNTSGICDHFVTRAVEQLGGRQAAVLGLRFYSGLSQIETARRIGISKTAVAVAERAAIGALRELLAPAA